MTAYSRGSWDVRPSRVFKMQVVSEAIAGKPHLYLA